MARIYKRTDRITVKIDDIVVKLAPMSMHQKAEVQMAMVNGSKNSDLRELTRGMSLALQFTLKGIEGVEDSDGQPYKLQFEDDGNLTSECINDLMNLELTTKLCTVCCELVQGVPSESFSDTKGKPLQGVELVKPSKVSDSPKV